MYFDKSTGKKRMKLLEFMEQTAREAGAFTIEAYARLGHDISEKATDKDIVTEADKQTEARIISRLKAAYPGYSILAEESGREDHAGTEWLWVIDPIDGTANYTAGLKDYCVSIGLYRNGKPYAGVIFAPRLNELYAAELGHGATLNGKPIRVSACRELIGTLAVTGFACLRANLPKNNLPAFCRIAPLVRGIRRFGSAALDLCHAAAGRIGFYWEYPLSLYDIAAGAIILREAGGTVTDFDGGEDFPQKGILGSNGLLHETVRKLVLENDYR